MRTMIMILALAIPLSAQSTETDTEVSKDEQQQRMEIIVKESKRVVDSLGDYSIVTPESNLRLSEFRRSIVTTKELSAGIIITSEDIEYKRPGIGISPGETKYVIGRTLKKDIGKDRLIKWDDLI